jgi:hypothetical protein
MTGYNPHFKSQFASYPDMIAASRIYLAKNGLSVIHCMDIVGGQSVLVTILGHSSGQYISSRIPITNEKNTIQSLGSSITYLKRYSYSAIIGMAVREKEDDDGNEAVGTAPQLKLTPKQIKQLSDLFIGYNDLKARVFKSEGVSRWEDIIQEAIPDILEFFQKETGE